MIVEPEFASVLSVAERPGNTISPLIRRAWDGDKLQTITKNSPLCATGAHISMIGHITEDELRARITRTELANGFANRFLFALIRRSKELPFGGAVIDSEILDLGNRLTSIVEKIKPVGRVKMNTPARQKWQTFTVHYRLNSMGFRERLPREPKHKPCALHCSTPCSMARTRLMSRI